MTDSLSPPEPRGTGPAGPGPLAPPLSVEAVRQAILTDLQTDPGVPDGHRGSLTFALNGNGLEVATATRVLEKGSLRWDVGAVVRQPLTGGGTSFGILGKITW